MKRYSFPYVKFKFSCNDAFGLSSHRNFSWLIPNWPVQAPRCKLKTVECQVVWLIREGCILAETNDYKNQLDEKFLKISSWKVGSWNSFSFELRFTCWTIGFGDEQNSWVIPCHTTFPSYRNRSLEKIKVAMVKGKIKPNYLLFKQSSSYLSTALLIVLCWWVTTT